MSRSYRHEAPALRRAKSIRRERLRPLRQFLGEHKLYPRLILSDYDTESVRLVPDGGSSLRIDLTQPLDFGQVLDCLEEAVDQRQTWLDQESDRIDNARQEADHE